MSENEHEGADQMVQIRDRDKPMSAAALNVLTRSMAHELVHRAERNSGSRTIAYEIVAQTVGTSSSWLRKFLAKSDEAKEPRITLFQNIRAAYDQLCERVELENENDELRLRLLKDNIDAAAECAHAQDSLKNKAFLQSGEEE